MIGNIISYFFVYLQKFNINVVSLPISSYNDYINKEEPNNHYLEFTIPYLLWKYAVIIPANINENHRLLLVILPLAGQYYQLILSLSYENNSVLDFALFFFKYTLVHIKSMSTKNSGVTITTKVFENKKINPTEVYWFC